MLHTDKQIRSGVVLVAATVLMVAACGNEGPTTTFGSQGTGTTSTTEAPATVPSTSTTTSASTTTSVPTTTSGPSTTTTSAGGVPGEPIDIGPAAGDVMAAVGVAYDDVLNLREAPGTDQPVLARLASTANDLVALGMARQLSQSIWFAVEADGTEGWVSSAFIAYLGSTADVTASTLAALGETPSAPTMLDLGMEIAEHIAAPSSSARITVTVAPTSGDLGEVTLDILGLEDDSIGGVRIHVLGTPESGGFVLKTIEQTLLCSRGIGAEEGCI